eukprot:CAMPEP_0114520544 /NCGR_PEP_ID=MMETSP0109-20121206/19636_1 /TAXON_ID=29199 /ORGANISM="Chlorarachnion reptans, Strain CCCM449" /LENGTH=362 /DNA_ID=CAMNT_0001701443 /DNA_START=23 /DNA_END=1111 /DNA_ORIENTATION=+
MPLDPSAYLAKFGWSKGDGLGKDGSGLKTFVKVTKRERDDMTGIGAATENWNHAAKFDSIFAEAAARTSIKIKKGKKKKEEEKEKKKKKKKRKKTTTVENDKEKDANSTAADPYAGMFSVPVMMKSEDNAGKKKKKKKKKKSSEADVTKGLYANRSMAKLLRLQRQEQELLTKLSLENENGRENDHDKRKTNTSTKRKDNGEDSKSKKKKRKKKPRKEKQESTEGGKVKKKRKRCLSDDESATSVSKYKRSGIRRVFEKKITQSKKQSQFNAAGGMGFTTSFQADYYEAMMGAASSKKKRGLGFSTSTDNGSGGLSSFVSGGDLGSKEEKVEIILSESKKKEKSKKKKKEKSKKKKKKKKTS